MAEESARPSLLSGAAIRRFSPRDRPRWALERFRDVPPPPVPVDLVALAAARARAAVALPSRLASTAIARTGIAAVLARAFPGLDAEGSAYDGSLAVGRSHVLVAQNFAVAIFDKASGAKLEDTNLHDWFPSRPAEAQFVFDPRVLHDQYADRWIAIALAWNQSTVTGIQGSWLLFSVSRDADPTGEWLGSALDTFRDPATPDGWADYPSLGVDARAVYLAYNVKGGAARLLAFDKADLYDDGSARCFDLGMLRNPDGTAATAVQPCHHFGETSAAHLVKTITPGDQPSRTVVLRSVIWTAGAPSVSDPRAVTVHPYAAPPKEADQLGEKALDVGGVRVRGAVSRAGSIWLSHASAYGTGVPGDAWIAARWYRVDAASGMVQAQDEIAETGAYHVFPNLVVDEAGTLLVIASRSAPGEHPSLHYGRWPTSGVAQSGMLVPGRGPHRKCRGNQSCDDPGARNGWGDYNGIALDPDGATVWAFGGVGHATDRTLWATAIVAL